MSEELKFRSWTEVRITGPLIYEIAFVGYFTIAFLQTSMYTEFLSGNLLRYTSFIWLGLVLFKIFFMDRQALGGLLCNVFFVGLLVLTWRTSQNMELLAMGIFILGARDVEFRKIIKLYLIIGIAILAFIVVSSMTGVIRNLIYHRGQGSVARQSFGVVYPTDLAAHVLYIALAYTYLKFSKLSYPFYLTLFLLSIVVIKITDARLDALALLLIIPIVMIGQRARKNKVTSGIIASLFWTIPIVSAYVTIILNVFYTQLNPILSNLDEILSGRLSLGYKAVNDYGFRTFGQYIPQHGWGGLSGFKMAASNQQRYFFIDSSFLRIPIMYGVIAGILVIMIMTVIAWRSTHYELYTLASILVVVAVSSMVEQRLTDISYDPFLIALLAVQHNVKQRKDNNHERLYFKRIG